MVAISNKWSLKKISLGYVVIEGNDTGVQF